MKIAINTLSEDPQSPSGALGYYINLIREISRVGKDNTFYLFVSRANQNLFGPYEENNVKKILFPFSNERQKYRVLTEHFLFAPALRKYDIDVLNTGVAPLYCPCKLVITMKTMHAYTNPNELPFSTLLYRRLIYPWTIKKADAIISNSKSHAKDLKKYLNVPNNKIKLVYEAIDHSIFFPIKDKTVFDPELSSFGLKRPFILFVSSLWPYKNAETLVDAYAMFKQQCPKYMLVIVGFARERNYLMKLKERASKHSISESVVFTGGVPHTILAKFYQTASVFVYPSLYETFGLTILEAMACGCPVITSNVSSMPEIAGGAAVLFDPRNTEKLNQKLRKVLSDEKIKEIITNKGLKRASEFTWEKTAKKTLEAFLN